MERETFDDQHGGDDEVYFKFEDEEIRSLSQKTAAVEAEPTA